VKAWIGNLRDGRRLLAVPHTAASWQQTLNRTDSTSVTVPLYASSQASETYRRIVADARLLDLRNTATVGKTFLALEDDGKVVGGPLVSRDYDANDKTVTLSGAGMLTYFDARTILPPQAASTPLSDAQGAPDTSLDTTLTNLTWRTINKRIVQQALAWPTSVQCITFEEDATGTNGVTYRAVDLDSIGTVLENNSRRLNGCDFGFFPQRTPDRRGFEWMLRTGNPRLNTHVTHRFDNTASKRPLTDLENAEDGSTLATRAWVTGGKGDDKVLVGTAENTTLTDTGAPIWETVDTSHTSVTDPDTLESYAREIVRTGYQAVSGTPLKIHISALRNTGQLDIGNILTFKTINEWMFTDGWHTRRIQALAHNENSDFIEVTLGTVFTDTDTDTPQGDPYNG
jgi:hypothetical protein